MSLRIAMNRPVEVTGFTFKGLKELRYFPKRMEYNGQTIHFKDGLSYYFKTGNKTGGIFDMQDNQGSHFRLKYDAESSLWTLLRIVRIV